MTRVVSGACSTLGCTTHVPRMSRRDRHAALFRCHHQTLSILYFNSRDGYRSGNVGHKNAELAYKVLIRPGRSRSCRLRQASLSHFLPAAGHPPHSSRRMYLFPNRRLGEWPFERTVRFYIRRKLENIKSIYLAWYYIRRQLPHH